MPLGDAAILVRFSDALSNEANAAAIGFAIDLERESLSGIVEVAPNLVSVLVRYDPVRSDFETITGALRLRLSRAPAAVADAQNWVINTIFDGADIEEAASVLGMSVPAFVSVHNAKPLRVLATGFAPGFVYCGLHPDALVLPRRTTVRASVPAGTVLFAAGQTAITATEIPTGWHVIGRTDFINFDATAEAPTRLRAGDRVSFAVQP